ncbi:MAG: hypothetical protein O3B73_10010 [bacterium]|nr:hypothetical protein [bacterium]
MTNPNRIRTVRLMSFMGGFGFRTCPGAKFFTMGLLILTFPLYGVAQADLAIHNVRLARADVDGDGQVEVVAGGPIGAAMAVDVPRNFRVAGVGIYRAAGPLLHPLYERSDLFAVSDVAGGDVDGDGRDEIAVVGMGHLLLLDFIDDRLVDLARVELRSDRTDRVVVIDLDADGRSEIGVTVYFLGADSEVGRSEIVFYEWNPEGLRIKSSFSLEGHIGDMSSLPPSDMKSGIALEIGWGDESAGIRLVDARNGQVFWHGQTIGDLGRILNLDALNDTLVMGGSDGRISMAKISRVGLSKPVNFRRFQSPSGFVCLPTGLMIFSDHAPAQLIGF